jgi:uncharacterized RDD family membrane protein YckC
MSVIHPDPASSHPLQLPVAALGSRVTRAAALVLDGIVIVLPAVVLGVVAGGSSTAIAIAWFFVTVFYAPLLMARKGAHNGQTLAKQWLSLRVVTTAGVPVTLGVGFKRHLLGQSLLSAITLGIYPLFDYAWVLWDANKQTLHDKIASTYVFTASSDPTLARQLNRPTIPIGSPAPPPPPPPPPSAPVA